MNAAVFTTIMPPTEAVKKWVGSKNFQLVVGVGDKKTPAGWKLKGCTFLPASKQSGKLAEAIPWNHYCRKMLGYVKAVRLGATTILDTDDDNIPKPDWSVPAFEGRYQVVDTDTEFFNAYRIFCDLPVWPRGFPLPLATKRQNKVIREQKIKVGVWQGLADEDPDVDAIYRMLSPGLLVFRRRPPVVLARGVACPFNSQNTVFCKELFPLLYLPSVNFRFTDILRSLVAQPIMWQMGYQVGFTEATVVQKRNPHDYMDDFKSEIPMYLHAAVIHRIVARAVRKELNAAENLIQAYCALIMHGVVSTDELPKLTAWLTELGYPKLLRQSLGHYIAASMASL